MSSAVDGGTGLPTFPCMALPSDAPLRDVFARWLDQHEQPHYAPTTKARYLRLYERFEAFVDAIVSDDLPEHLVLAEPAMVRAFLESLALSCRDQVPLTGAQFNAAKKALRAFYAMLIECGEITSNPTTRIPARRLADTERPILTSDQLWTIMTTGPEAAEPERIRNNAILATFVQTGMRVAECTRLGISQVSFPSSRVTSVLTKGGGMESFTINDVYRASLSAYWPVREAWCVADDPDSHHALFLARRSGKRLSTRQIQKLVARRGEMIGIEGLSPHDLRAGAARLLLNANVKLEDIQRFLRHKRLETTWLYLRSIVGKDEAASQALEAVFAPHSLATDRSPKVGESLLTGAGPQGNPHSLSSVFHHDTSPLWERVLLRPHRNVP